MGIFGCKKLSWSKRYLIAFIITLLLSVMSGIVLFIIVGLNSYFENFADIYIYRIFNFKNGKLFFSHFLAEVILFYLVFLISYFTGKKAFTLPVVFFKGFYTAFYTLALCSCFKSGGALAAFIVFVPCSLVSLFCAFVVCEQSRTLKRSYAFFAPLFLSLITSVIFLLFINIIFRVAVVIV